MSLNSPLLVTETSTLLPLKNPADFTVSDTAGIADSSLITGIDAFLAAFGMPGAGLGGGDIHDGSGDSNADDEADEHDDSAMPETGAAGTGSAPAGGLNPGAGHPGAGQPGAGQPGAGLPGANPFGQPPAPLPGGQGQPVAPPPINPGAAGLPNQAGGAGENAGAAKPVAQSPFKGGAGGGHGPNSNPFGGGGFNFGSGSSGGGGGGNIFSGSSSALDVGTFIAAGVSGSTKLKSVFNPGQSSSSTTTSGNPGAGDKSVDQDMPPASTTDTARDAANEAANEAAYQRAQQLREEAEARRDKLDRDMAEFLKKTAIEKNQIGAEISAANGLAYQSAQKMLQDASARGDKYDQALVEYRNKAAIQQKLLDQCARQMEKVKSAITNDTGQTAQNKLMEDRYHTSIDNMQARLEKFAQAKKIGELVRAESKAKIAAAEQTAAAAIEKIRPETNAEHAMAQATIVVAQNEIIATNKKVIAGLDETAREEARSAGPLRGNIAWSKEQLKSLAEADHVLQSTILKNQKILVKAQEYIDSHTGILAGINANIGKLDLLRSQALAQYHHAEDLLKQLLPSHDTHHEADGDIHMSDASVHPSLAMFYSTQDEAPLAIPADDTAANPPAPTAPADAPGTDPDLADETADTHSSQPAPDSDPAGAPVTPAPRAELHPDPARPPAVVVTSPGHVTVQVAMVHAESPTEGPADGPAEVLELATVTHLLPLARAIIAAWVLSLPTPADIQIESVDVARPDAAGPVVLAIKFAIRTEPGAGTNEVISADAAEVLQSAIQCALSNWVHGDQDAVTHAASEATLVLLDSAAMHTIVIVPVNSDGNVLLPDATDFVDSTHAAEAGPAATTVEDAHSAGFSIVLVGTADSHLIAA